MKGGKWKMKKKVEGEKVKGERGKSERRKVKGEKCHNWFAIIVNLQKPYQTKMQRRKVQGGRRKRWKVKGGKVKGERWKGETLNMKDEKVITEMWSVDVSSKVSNRVIECCHNWFASILGGKRKVKNDRRKWKLKREKVKYGRWKSEKWNVKPRCQ